MKKHELFSLEGKNILLTGATGHLGRSMAWGLAEAGANVLINSRDHIRCKKLVADICDEGLKAECAVFDVLDEQSVEEFFLGKPDLAMHGLVNNAYSGGAGTIQSSSTLDYHNSYGMTVISAHRLLIHSLACIRRGYLATGDASVINIASMYGAVSPDLRIYDSQGCSNPPYYGAGKAALIQWTRYAACEFGPEGIRFNSISPGPFPSVKVQEDSPEFIKKLSEKVPLRRIGDPNEIKGLVVFLAGHSSSYVNGANISIDGGWTSW